MYLNKIVFVCLLGLGFFSIPNASNAEPYLAFKTNNKCSACHINPNGGGARTSYGAYYGSQMLPETLGKADSFDASQITENIRLGADLRFNYDNSDSDANDSQSFNTQSGQLYFTLQPKDSKVLLYFDQQFSPGDSVSREAFILTKLSENSYFKAGNLMLPYGIRLEDDSAFIRQASGMNFDNSDNGVEFGYEARAIQLNIAVSNGSSSTTNDDENFQLALRGEYMGGNWRAGASFVTNDAEAGQRQMANVFGGFNLAGFVFLGEIDTIIDESSASATDEDQEKLVAFLEVNKELKRGYNLKVTTEFLDPDSNIDENERTRHSVLIEYTPFPYLQIRGGVRVGEDIPQREAGNFTDIFAQLHMYY